VFQSEHWSRHSLRKWPEESVFKNAWFLDSVKTISVINLARWWRELNLPKDNIVIC
jgi:hypothetical protein